jgi:hypothetical protein
MKKLFKFISIFSFTAFFPFIAFALKGCPVDKNIGTLLCNIQQLLNSIIPILVALGVVYFVWGVVRFMIADSEEAKTKGKDTIIYGIIGFTVIVGVWGLVNIIVNTLGFTPGDLSMPTLAPLQNNGDTAGCGVVGENFQGFLKYLTCIINNSVIPFIFAIAIVMFIWGAVKFFIINSDEEAKREQGKQFMIWGIIALTVMTAVWGLVGILGNTFGIGGKVLPQVCPPGSEQCK